MSLDPEDWDDFSHEAHKVLDACIERLKDARNRPWQPVDDVARKALMPALPRSGMARADLTKALIDDVMPYATGNTHSNFFGWVNGTGLANSLLADMVAAAMNSNCGGRDHGGIYVEHAVLGWCREVFGFPADGSGLLTVGTSQASVVALSVARAKALGVDVRKKGIQDAPKMTTYCADGTHACVGKALEVMGHGSESLRKIATHGPSGGMDIDALKEVIAQDRAAGLKPFCVVGTAGSVNTGAFDDLNGLADLCAAEDLWLHVDGAFGAWAHIADAPWNDLTHGIERADSLAFDFHKWMSVNYDCGAVLIKDHDLHYETFATRAAYLAQQAEGLGGGDLWFCDYGIDLSRGFRALKVWTALQEHGLEAFGAAITENCKHAAHMAELVEASDALELGAPVVANVCTFRTAPDGMDGDAQDALNNRIVHKLQLDGTAVFSTTTIDGRTMIRAAIVNHRTVMRDIDVSIAAVLKALEI